VHIMCYKNIMCVYCMYVIRTACVYTVCYKNSMCVHAQYVLYEQHMCVHIMCVIRTACVHHMHQANGGQDQTNVRHNFTAQFTSLL